MSGIQVLGELAPTFAWDGEKLHLDGDLAPGTELPANLRGAASVAQTDGHGRWRLLRDPLGLNKIFWGYDSAGDVQMAARPATLVDAGIPLTEQYAIPPGCVVEVEPATGCLGSRSLMPERWRRSWDGGQVDLNRVGGIIRDQLERYLHALAEAFPDAPAFVCLSGGLDSSAVAALARRWFPRLVAVSFDLARPGAGASEDRVTAERLARDLGLSLLQVTVTEDELFGHLDTVLLHGIDWRDFNVHAGLVNAALASHIRGVCADPAPTAPPLVLTGDLANEFLADYEPELHGGVTYYGMPRLTGRRLQRSLVTGLDTSHREVGVLAAWGLRAVQPYAVAVDAYMSLPDAFFESGYRKQRLCRAAFGEAVPRYVYERRKSRAQIGGERSGGGVLAAAVSRGIDAAWLRRRFAELHGDADASRLHRFIRAGRYRSAIPFTDQER